MFFRSSSNSGGWQAQAESAFNAISKFRGCELDCSTFRDQMYCDVVDGSAWLCSALGEFGGEDGAKISISYGDKMLSVDFYFSKQRAAEVGDYEIRVTVEALEDDDVCFVCYGGRSYIQLTAMTSKSGLTSVLAELLGKAYAVLENIE